MKRQNCSLRRLLWVGAEVYYTGDIDTHGFAILDRFRARLHTRRAC